MIQHLWYVRRRGEIKGPFPAGQLREMFGDSELDLKDEVSLDKQNWVRLMETDVLKKAPPPEPHVTTDEVWQQEREKARQRWADDTEDGLDEVGADTEKTMERLREHEQATRVLLEAQSKKRPAFLSGVASLLILAAIGLLVWHGQSNNIVIRTASTTATTDCSRPPGDGVNWNGCIMNDAGMSRANLRNSQLKGIRLERADLAGADLSYADLTGADLRGANLRGAILKAATLSQADLTGADLSGSDLDYASLAAARINGVRFDGASLKQSTWVDGRVCGGASVGACQ